VIGTLSRIDAAIKLREIGEDKPWSVWRTRP
jgi:hypothetical protein